MRTSIAPAVPTGAAGISRNLAFTLAACSLGTFLAACGKGEEAAKAAPPPIAVQVKTIAVAEVPVLIDAVGRAEGSKEVEVRSRVSGIVQKQLYTEGETVKAGAVLFQIERAPFENALAQARAAANQDRTKVEQARRESARLAPLVAKRAISQREADDANSAVMQAEAAVLSSEARVRDAELNLSYTTVTAPIAGLTGRAQRSEGSLVAAGTESSLLTTVSQTDPVWVRFSLSETEHALLRGNAAKRAEVRLLDAADRELPIAGRVNFAGSTVDARQGTIQLRAEFANAGLTLLPGQFVRARLVAGTQQAVTVPQLAVFQNDQGRFVWVVGADGKATQKKVEAGSWIGRDWIIKSGLNAGDRVIIDNLVKMRPGTAVSVAPAPTPAGPATASPAPAKG